MAGTDLSGAQQVAARHLDANSLPLISVAIVQQLAVPGALVEVSAIAARPEVGDAAWLGRDQVRGPGLVLEGCSVASVRLASRPL